MKVSSKAAVAAALVAGAVGGAVAITPSYAQTATAGAPIAETAQFQARMGFGVGAAIAIGRPGAGPLAAGPGEDVLRLVARAEELLARFDANGDGVVTQEEIDAARAAELAEYDADGDGALTLEEYQAYWLARFFEQMVDAFQHLDANGDGKVTTAEFNAGLANIVARLDQNGDGALGADDRPERLEFEPEQRRGAIILGPRR